MPDPEILCRVNGIFLGAVRNRWPGKPPSAIDKRRVTGLQKISPTGFALDSQADMTVHGGSDKAIHHYATDHYRFWQVEGQMDSGTEPAAFGENIATNGLTEGALCIGDILRLGTAVVQVSQGRQPCWKLGLHTGNERMPALFTRTGRTGWYYRILEPGAAREGDEIALIERRNPAWTVKRVSAARLTRRVTPQDAEILSSLNDLADGWRRAFARMASGDTTEDVRKRLYGAHQ